MREDPPAHPEQATAAQESAGPMQAIVRLLEVEIHPLVSTAIPLNLSMPCCVQTNERLCGRGATSAIVLLNPARTWLLIPICAACARAIDLVSGHLPEL